MKILLPLAVASALSLGFYGEARAETQPIGKVGHWQISADETLCKARGVYADGTSLDFYMNNQGGMWIGIENPKWAVPEGDYQVTMQVDRAAPTTHNAKGNGNFVMWFAMVEEPIINLLSYGRDLYAQIGAQTYHYQLVRSEAMLRALGQCAAPHIAAANPFSGSSPAGRTETPASTETPSNPFRRL